MKRIIARRPSPATVLSAIALFVSLGGVSYGVATGSIDSREIKNNSVSTPDLRNNSVRAADIRNSTIRSRDVALNTLTGNDVAEGSLGKVPSASRADTAQNADTLGGKPAAAFAPPAVEPVRAPALAEGATAAEDRPPGFWKDPHGVVHLQGAVAGGAPLGEGSTRIFTLPEGYRPAADSVYRVPGTIMSSTVVLTVDESGAVSHDGQGAIGAVSLDGITFRAAG